jgi:hypothetical protein
VGWKPVWKLFLESDCEFDKRHLSESINERPNDSEKKLYTAIEKTKTDGKLNFETVTTKAVTTKPQMEHEKKNEFDQRRESSKKRKWRWGDTNSSNEEFVFVLKRKLFRKPTAATIILKKINRLAATMILKRENRQNLHVFNLWPVTYHTKKNSCGNPTPETLSVEISSSLGEAKNYRQQQYFVPLEINKVLLHSGTIAFLLH